MADTEVEESRGSIVFKDRDLHLFCGDQTVEDIALISPSDDDFLSDYMEFDRMKTTNPEFAESPVLVIRGHISSNRKKKKRRQCSASYCILFDQKNSNQIGFRVKIGLPKFELYQHHKVSGKHRRLRRYRKRKLGSGWFFTRTKGSVRAAPSKEEQRALNVGEGTFNRVFFSYA